METESSPQTTSDSPVTPAPYGRACAGCARAKSKCFYRSDSSGCERCHRLRMICQPSASVRKRKAQTQSPPPPPSRLEERLEDLVSLLRQQAVEKQIQAPQGIAQPVRGDNSTPSTLDTPTSHGVSIMSTPARDPDLEIDTANSVVHLLRPPNANPTSWPVHDDVTVHRVSQKTAAENLSTFRQAFLPMFPFVNIPASMTAADIRLQKPFLWLVIMALTSKRASTQFEMEETIWKVTSQRILAQQLADVDLLLGVVCFASWSHYFKQDKPFMSMLAQMAVSLAFALNLHEAPPAYMSRRVTTGRLRVQRQTKLKVRTLEERRTMLAVFHLTSSTWTAYRKTEPLRWTPYLNECLRIIGEGTETHLDILLATQVKCQIITNQLTCGGSLESADGSNSSAPSAAIATALLRQLNDIRQDLPAHISTERACQFYLYGTELTIQECLIGSSRRLDQTGMSHIRRLQHLDAILTSCERWLSLFLETELTSWIGISVDIFAQFTHSLVTLFGLTTLDEPNWDTDEVRTRADVFDTLDRACDKVDQIPAALGMVDAEGPRSGLFFKTNYLFRAIKSLFQDAMGSNVVADEGRSKDVAEGSSVGTEDPAEALIVDDFLMNLSDEPWFSDMLGPSWDFGLQGDSSLYTPFAS